MGSDRHLLMDAAGVGFLPLTIICEGIYIEEVILIWKPISDKPS